MRNRQPRTAPFHFACDNILMVGNLFEHRRRRREADVEKEGLR